MSFQNNLTTGCFQQCKDTKMKANHNKKLPVDFKFSLFPTMQRYKNESKSQHDDEYGLSQKSCFQQCKDTKMKANHNTPSDMARMHAAVSNNAKIQK